MYEVKVKGMTCGSCAAAMRFALRAGDPDATVSVDLKTQTVLIQTDEDEKSVTEIIEGAGYPVIELRRVN